MQAAQRPDWSGRTVACLASGPSLTKEDCDAVRAAGLPTIVTNTTFRLAPWADVLIAFDARWWRHYIAEVQATFEGRKLIACDMCNERLPIESLHNLPWFTRLGNTGACAISLAMAGRAARVILLGYDCMEGPRGEKHWHGNHPSRFTNCASIKDWPYQFKHAAKLARAAGVRVVNCSRRTALTWFERGELATELQREAVAA